MASFNDCLYEARDEDRRTGIARAWCLTHDAWAGECSLEGSQARIAELEKLIRDLLDARKNGCLEMDSPDIGGHDDVPVRPWHEEWLHRAERAVGGDRARRA